ncbi:DUF308 domain-containing protein [Geodermatophilus sp. YIM 151500]|uniref:HdeD family acid-resistance protein n=1 Tax=Geodermatophilus sp. YIM 151500 TaxID=2984531 RepID=UPI0021E38267|nr:DUF308 domain-containing protein [Geodermatophilus sp. YIM 151500]MCV2491792.1 DUF308 domain-containing protein [Geodermatophilus sp. YIM 151500]
MRSLQAGTASFHDVAWSAMSRRPAVRLGEAVAAERRGTTVRGLTGVAVGVAIAVWPEASLTALVVVVASYALLDGVLVLVGLLHPGHRRWQQAVEGMASLATAACVVIWPDVTARALLHVLAVWVVVMGALRLRAALEFGHAVRIRWVPALLALLGIVAGCTVFVAPERSPTGLVVNLAVFAVLNGLAEIAEGVRARSARDP